MGRVVYRLSFIVYRLVLGLVFGFRPRAPEPFEVRSAGMDHGFMDTDRRPDARALPTFFFKASSPGRDAPRASARDVLRAGERRGRDARMSFRVKGPQTAAGSRWESRWESGWIAVTLAAALGALGAGLSGCTTDAFCFTDCTAGTGGGSSGSGSSGSSGSMGSNAGGGFVGSSGSGTDCFPNCTNATSGGGNCTVTNDGVEICDGKDNDCNGKVDDIPGLNLDDAKTCGTCSNNCYATSTNCATDKIRCTGTSAPKPGETPGTCKCDGCDTDYYDLDKNGTCEYYCVKVDANASTDATCDYRDDDCDGIKDEDVDLCSSTDNCGKCGGKCFSLHSTPVCVHTGTDPCGPANTQCQLKACDCTGPGNCWWDLDKSYATGCEYLCDLTHGGVEVCGDGLDNDCDGKIDEADDLSGDPAIGVSCVGDPDGECGTQAHAGTTQCIGNKVVCVGPSVLHQGEVPETCNGKDDDCNGNVDDNPKDAGGACGVSNLFPCTLGTQQCVSGALVCIGESDPQPEVCDGQDNDCDGQIDKTGNMPPANSVGACDVPPKPPTGATSPCKAGGKACLGGTVQCVGSVLPTATHDTCGVDANCDGQLSNQPDLQTDIHNCGACGNDCLDGAVHANWSCAAGVCQFQGCQTGYVDNDNDKKCEYACTFISAQESCNGLDDNCNGQTDEGVIAPSPTQVCGVSPSASSAECTSGVTVACQGGSWKCTFPAGVCNPTCSSAAEVCDALDNNCNGLLNENVANYGKPCASDDGKPAPGDGACRTTGTIVCNGSSSVKCSAVKNNAAAGAELCDGVDNDCDGLVDEPFTSKGTNPTYFVKPAVTMVSNVLWIMSYEASRPNAGPTPTSTIPTPGSGNGYFTSAPPGITLDKTPACSTQGRLPWSDVTGVEVEQTCQAIGGHACSLTEWQTSCRAYNNCVWGYATRASGCKLPSTASKYCNLATSYDSDPAKAGDQDALLPTGSPLLAGCYVDMSGIFSNTPATNKIFDMTGNLREIVTIGTNQYNLMGGAFDAQSEAGATCDFTFYAVDDKFKFFDTGFRCCFSQDPSL
jgi:Putative metal-binding motif